MKSYNIDPALDALFPKLSSEEYLMLEDSIKSEGVREPIVVWNDTIIDGHNRYRICKTHGLDFPVREMWFEDIEDVKVWMIRNQLGRRNLPSFTRITLVQRMEHLVQKKAKENLVTSTGGRARQPLQDLAKAENGQINTRKEMAQMAGVSEETYRRGKTILEQGTPEQIEAVQSGEKSINAVYNEINPPKPKKSKDPFKELDKLIQKKKKEPKKPKTYDMPPMEFLPLPDPVAKEEAEPAAPAMITPAPAAPIAPAAPATYGDVPFVPIDKITEGQQAESEEPENIIDCGPEKIGRWQKAQSFYDDIMGAATKLSFLDKYEYLIPDDDEKLSFLKELDKSQLVELEKTFEHIENVCMKIHINLQVAFGINLPE